MITATMANDVQLLSRATALGWVADQPHIEKRYRCLVASAPRMPIRLGDAGLFGVLE